MKNQFTPMHTILKEQIRQAGGHISFDEFMAAALYHAEHGYYTTQSNPIGQAGDFVTAPELSREFSLCIANFCQQHLTHLDGSILEFGAGNGSMAAEIIASLPENTFHKYYIYDVSPTLRQNQYDLIQQKCPDKLTKVEWLDELPRTFTGVILANEVLDAMPVKKFQIKNNDIYEINVAVQDDELHWLPVNADAKLSKAVKKIVNQYQLSEDGYESEINFNLTEWFNQLDKVVNQAVMLIIDYGFPGAEYYHASRHQGTIMCHQQHKAHPDPLFQPGCQDITAHVDFTHVAEITSSLNWQVEQFTTQAYFLLELGLMDYLGTQDTWQAKQVVKQLTLPHEMGELFKVMVLSKNYNSPTITSHWPCLLNRL